MTGPVPRAALAEKRKAELVTSEPAFMALAWETNIVWLA